MLDDALSAVDTDTESQILDALAERRGRHTTIIIAHRLSSLVHADEIIFLEAGSIVERGSHEALLALGGRYAALHALQSPASDADLGES